MTRAQPPLTVIGGYLGAGKTTMLNHLLHNTGGSRIALLVNDFGDVNIDADLISSTGSETVALANGCICCSLVDGLAAVLADLRGRADSLDHIVVEASGVSDPVSIGQYGAAFGFPLTGVVVVVDAEQVRGLADDKYVGETVIRQLQCADLLVLNKVDLVTADELDSVRRWLAGHAPDAKTFVREQGRPFAELVLGGSAVSLRAGGGISAGGHAQFQSWCVATEAPVTRDTVETFVAALPAGVLRVKGFLRLAGDLDRQYVLQVMGRRFSLTPRAGGDRRDGPDRLVVIGVPGSFDERLAARTWGARSSAGSA